MTALVQQWCNSKTLDPLPDHLRDPTPRSPERPIPRPTPRPTPDHPTLQYDSRRSLVPYHGMTSVFTQSKMDKRTGRATYYEYLIQWEWEGHDSYISHVTMVSYDVTILSPRVIHKYQVLLSSESTVKFKWSYTSSCTCL